MLNTKQNQPVAFSSSPTSFPDRALRRLRQLAATNAPIINPKKVRVDGSGIVVVRDSEGAEGSIENGRGAKNGSKKFTGVIATSPT